MSARYPHLGFDPAPGDLGELETLMSGLSQLGSHVSGAPIGLTTSADGTLWQGAAADAFSETANALLRSLGVTANMYAALKGALQDWHDKLVQFELQAIQLDRTVEAWQDRLKTLGDTATEQQIQEAESEIAKARARAHELARQHKNAAAGIAARLRG